MPLSILKKVRSFIKKDAAPKKENTPVSTNVSTAPQNPAPKKASIREEKPSDHHAPAPLKEVKKIRAAQPEEWRPGKGPKLEETEPKSRREGQRPPRNRSPRPPRQAGERNEGGNRPPRQRQPRKPSTGEGRAPRNREERDPRPGSTRGKGFSFPRPKPEAGNWSPADVQIPLAEGKTRFSEIGLADELLHAISDLGYQYCTPIQAEILPELLGGRDGMGQAQTGTGKTAAFLLASLTRLLKDPKPDLPNGCPRMLILAPTRELVLQIEEEAATLMKYTPLQSLPVYGGLDYEPQKEALRHHRVDLVSATPGRLIDFMRSRVIDLSHVEILVLDEADRMLDMGFIPDVKRIVYATPHKDKRQTLFFSATFTEDIKRLATSWTHEPINIVITPTSVAADTVDQTVYIVTDKEKFALTVNLLRKLNPPRTLIFANRRDTSQDLCDHLNVYGFQAALLSGAVPQAKRVRTLDDFKSGKTPIVVATDVAGRGIHVDEVGLVINYNLPEDPEDYVHRIGRTGRAGDEGQSVCFASEFDSMMLPDIEKFIGRELKCTHPEEEWLTVEEREIPRRERRSSGGGGGGGRSAGGRGRPGGGGGRGRTGGGRGRR
jgi:ATP-dependent RNA helicase RhlB